ncbi:hypothetical protein TNCV_2885511 [Trichonephila clavipes]|nr:hypothetical protein TNCV_2885511 [Trichonephila clavipes]
MFYRPFGNFTERNYTVTCMVLKVKVNDRRTSSPCHDEFRGPRSDSVRQNTFLVRCVCKMSRECYTFRILRLVSVLFFEASETSSLNEITHDYMVLSVSTSQQKVFDCYPASTFPSFPVL